MNNLLLDRIEESFNLTFDLIENLSNDLLEKKIPKIRSNTIGEQFWCIIGARQSYIKAIEHKKWIGFSCDLEKPITVEKLSIKLTETLQKLKEKTLNFDLFTQDQINILFDLLTHEIQHHGQLIRFFYALNIDFPKTWNKKYTV